MNWDEKAYLEDGRRREIGSGFPCLTDELFTDGAKWQRDQLRTDEAIERVAESIWTTDPEPALEPFDGPEAWEVLEPELKDDYRVAARHAIAALLEQEPRP